MKPRPLPSFALSLFILLLPAAAGAQEVWRCGADGSSYSATPCAEGRRVEVPAPRPAEDVAAARAAAQRELAQAQALAQAEQRERARQDAQQRGKGGRATAAAPAPVKAATSPSSARKGSKRPHPEEAGIWRAVVPASRQKTG